jgi:alpha-glucosidase
MSRPRDSEATSGRLWWRDGTVYQIYPRSYGDANGDGVGDLEGIRQRLDHLAWLGVDAIWLSPIFPSPMADFGYDVADYCDVDRSFGNLADFDRLLADAHALGIRVILDWVPAHTSVEHPWFRESRSSRTSPKRDWYFWRDPCPDGSPPNNWLAVFGGSAWEPDPTTGQCYLHSHLVEQPDLNWRNPEVVAAMHDVLRFWLDRGVDGFRIDVIHRILKDAELRDNPPIQGREGHGYGGQHHLYDENHADVHAALREIRKLLDGYDERMAVGEVYILDPQTVARYYGRGDQLHLAFNFRLTHAPWDAAVFRREVEDFDALVPEGCWPDLVLSSHDAPRHASRYDDPRWGEARARVAALLLLAARGTPFLYYGEEIGMRNVPIAPEDMLDPLARTLDPKVARDPERCPMQWQPGPGAGFTTGRPWLPLAPDATKRNVAVQREDRRSLLWLYRDAIALRRESVALRRGSHATLKAPDGVFAFERVNDEERAVVALNFTAEPQTVSLGSGAATRGLHTTPGARLPSELAAVELGPCEGLVAIQDR